MEKIELPKLKSWTAKKLMKYILKDYVSRVTQGKYYVTQLDVQKIYDTFNEAERYNFERLTIIPDILGEARAKQILCDNVSVKNLNMIEICYGILQYIQKRKKGSKL